MKKYFSRITFLCCIFSFLLLTPQKSYSQFFNLGAFWKNQNAPAPISGVWETRRYGPPYPVADHTVVWTNSEMIIWGGRSEPNKMTTRGAKYNPTTDTWTEIAQSNYLMPVRQHTAVWTGTEMIVWGGGNHITDCTLAVHRNGGKYNPSTDTWTQVTITGAPVPRCMHTAVWTGTEMIIWGGYSNGYSQTGGKYNPSTDTWVATSTGANVPTTRQNHTAVWTGTEMIVYGGRGAGYLNTGARYTPGTNTWAAMTADSPRINHTAVWTGSVMMVWGGLSAASTYTNTGGLYDPGSNTWSATLTAGSAPSARADNSMIWTGSEAIVFGGYNGTNRFGDGAKYTPGTNTWVALSSTNIPSARSNHSAIWTGTQMIIWGGYGGTNATYLHDGGRYTPGTDTWTSMSQGNAPYPVLWMNGRRLGNEILFFGSEEGTYSAQGYRYNYVTDTWTWMDTTNAPLASHAHAIDAAATELLVWGGVNSGGTAVNTGAKYNPSSNTWTTMSASGLTARKFVHSLWTGTVWIIWGGLNNSDAYLGSGSRYNPSTDSWSPITATNAPSAREGGVVAWTGTEMIIWSGRDGPWATVNGGSRYNPSTDIWTTMSSSGQPVARMYGYGAWTGTEMVTWGGIRSTGTYMETGGKYNLSSDTWSSTTTANAPTGRYGGTFRWTGSEIITWGGRDATTAYNDGAKYSPTWNRWVTMSMVDVPAVRHGMSSSWIAVDNKMLVFGGSNFGSMRDSYVHLYDPNNERAAVDCQNGGTTPIGALCTGGAIYAGMWDGIRYMVTPSGCTGSGASVTCSGAEDTLMFTWRGTSGSNTDIPGVETVGAAATASTVRGEVNMAAAIAHASVSSDSAHNYCNDMEYGGHTDWYLPSKSEMAYIYCQAVESSHNAIMPEERPNCSYYFGGKRSVLTGFKNGGSTAYWTSTEYNSSNGWKQSFVNGNQDFHTKAGSHYVRCIRRY